MIKLLADKYLYALSNYIPEQISTTLFDPSDGIPDPEGFDALFIRTVSKVDAVHLPNTRSLKFIATGSSGSDHVDIDHLSEAGITFADAKGCNARAVAEYVITSILIWADNKGTDPSCMQFAVVGVGAVGTAVCELMDVLGWRHVTYDPPREIREKEFNSCSIDDILSSDVITLHVPLNRSGNYPTFHWLNRECIFSSKFKLIVNASRGSVTDESALIDWKNEDHERSLITDVWENEPDFDPEFARQSYFATPHIAGYSEQSKRRATQMIVEKMCAYFDLQKPNSITNTYREIHSSSLEDLHTSAEILSFIHPLPDYDRKLRAIAERKDRATRFRQLRTDHSYRFEYQHIRIPQEYINTHPLLGKLGLSGASF